MSRRNLIAAIAARIVTLRSSGIVFVGVDGVDGAGKTYFADELAETIVGHRRPVIRISVDAFHNPRVVRYRQGRSSPRGYFDDSYDYDALVKRVLAPLSAGGTLQYVSAAFDLERDTPVECDERQAAPDSVLIVDGIFLNRNELWAYWHLSILLDVPFDVSIARLANRDGTSPDHNAESNHRYVAGQRIYFRECHPRGRASLIINNSDLDVPYVVEASNANV